MKQPIHSRPTRQRQSAANNSRQSPAANSDTPTISEVNSTSNIRHRLTTASYAMLVVLGIVYAAAILPPTISLLVAAWTVGIGLAIAAPFVAIFVAVRATDGYHRLRQLARRTNNRTEQAPCAHCK